MKLAIATTLLTSAAAFAPAAIPTTAAVSSLNAEASKSLPFMNRPTLVSFFVCSVLFDFRVCVCVCCAGLIDICFNRIPKECVYVTNVYFF